MPDTSLVAAGHTDILPGLNSHVVALLIRLNGHLYDRTVIRFSYAESTAALVGQLVWTLRLVARVVLQSWVILFYSVRVQPVRTCVREISRATGRRRATITQLTADRVARIIVFASLVQICLRL